MTAPLLRELRAVLGDGDVLTGADTQAHVHDQMPLVPAGEPLAVVTPRNVSGIQACVRACAATGVPIVPRGAGSGLTGAANAVDGCVVLLTTRMNRILKIDPDNRMAVVEPGVVNAELRGAAARQNLFYPPDPSSRDWCTIGGNLATNAGGLCCGKYGVTADSVLGLHAVLADGSLLHTGRRTVKGVAGYDLTRLLVGSEGTLGIITQATLALRPRPHPSATLVATFSRAEAAGRAVIGVVRAGIVPALMEIMDATSLRACEAYLRTDLGVGTRGALLLCQVDSGGEAAEQELAGIAEACTLAGAELVHSTRDRAEGEMLLRARRVSLTALEALGPCMTEDVAVPRTRIAELITGCGRIGTELGLPVAVVGHAGDGNMHPTVMYGAGSAEQYSRAAAAFDQILELALTLGGTVTGEHGIGRLKRPWLERELGEVAMGVHRQIKAALDPYNLFNPGAMFAQRVEAPA